MGALRPALRRHRGAADRGRGPALPTAPACTPCGASSRTARACCAARCAASGRSSACGGRCRARSPPARCSALVVSATLVANGRDLARHGVPAVPVRAADVAAARGPRPPAGDGAEGQRGDGARHRPARRARPTIVDGGTTSPPPGALAVSCRGVSFTYADGRTASTRRPDARRRADDPPRPRPGHRRRPLGRRRRPDGSGKTTFSRLLLRLVEATEGTLALGGVPIADIPLAELRRRVALVPQEVELFAGTVRDNVTLFDPAPTDAAVIDALDRVGLAPARRRRHPPPARRRRRRAVGRRGPAAGAGPGVAAPTRPRRARRGDGAHRSRSPSSGWRPPSPSSSPGARR